MKLFSTEQISKYHPDKFADQISDAILTECLSQDRDSHCGIETMVKDNTVVLGGEITTNAKVDYIDIVRRVASKLGYTVDAVINLIGKQSHEINEAVTSEKKIGAGDQGIMFGYAVEETREFMPATLILSHVILKELAVIRREGEVMRYLRPDSKSQVTIEYGDDRRPQRVHTIVVSTQHDEFILPTHTRTEAEAEREMQRIIADDVRNILIPRVKARLERANDKLAELINDDYILHVNPTGKFVIGGPHGDTGLTGRKIIVDTYGGRGAHGGGAFSGKDSSKEDRSAAYAARHIAKNMVAAGVAREMLVQVSYAIGIAQPLSIYVDTYGTSNVNLTDGQIAEKISAMFDLRPASIVERFGLKYPIFEATASYGHFGRRPYTELVRFIGEGKEFAKEVEFFSWEKLDEVDNIKQEFGL